MAQRIGFLKIWGFSHVNDIMVRELSRAFPGYPIDVIDVRDLVKMRTELVLLNTFAILHEYGPAILMGKKRAKSCFFITSYIFKSIKKLVARELTRGEYLFSFQTQSLFDGSTRCFPHFVYTDHTALANLHYPDVDNRAMLYSKQWLALEHAIYANADLVFTTSTFAADSIVEAYGIERGKVQCVYSGINVPMLPNLQEHSYNGKEILFVGAEWERKGGPELVAAFKMLLQQHPEARLTIAGCTPQVNLPNCEVLGRLPPDELVPYYQNATLFCMPSKREPSAVALVEAAAYGLPVVSTDIGGTPDRVIHGKSGLLVRPGDVDALAAALAELLADPQKCRSFGEYGAALAAERFSWQKTGDTIKAGIERFLNDSADGSRKYSGATDSKQRRMRLS